MASSGPVPDPEPAPPQPGSPLPETEASFRDLVQQLPQIVFELDLQGRLTFANQYALETMGYTGQELARGLLLLDLFPPGERERVARNAQKRLRGEAFEDHEYTILRRDGTPLNVMVFTSPILRDGCPVGLRGVVVDITDRKRMEEDLRRAKEDLERREHRRTDELRKAVAALERSERYYRELFENAHDAIVIFEPGGEVVLDANQRACDLYGYGRDEFVGMSLKRISKDVPLGEQRIRETLERGTFQGFQTTQWRKDGSEMLLEINASVIDYRGRKAILSVNRDVTERTKAQRALLESEGKFRAVVEQSWESIYLADIDTGQVLEANPAICRMLGYSREELLGLTLFDFVKHERRSIREAMQRILQSGAHYLGPRVWKRKDGASTEVEVAVSRITWRDRPVFCVVARDASERRRMEEERDRLQRQLFQSQKMEAVGLLAGGIAHDFNNLLTAMIGHAELGLKRAPGDEPPEATFEKILETARRAAALTDQLLQFSRKRPPEVRRVDLNRTVANLLSMLGRVIGGDVAVRPRLASDLHPIAASESGLEQVLMNLVVNARDAMPRGGTLTVRTENVAVGAEAAGKRPEARAGSFVLLSVEDTGVGMPDETLQHLFEPFFTTKKPGAGTGLGLSVVYGIVRQHGGWIDVSSEPGKGSAFRVYLPAAPGTADEPGEGESPAPASTAPGGRILFVEDDPSIRDFAEKALRRAGYSVRTCASAAEAQDAFEASGGAFDLILSDMIMPGRGGADLAVALWARQPGLRVVLTSGYTTEGLPASPEGSPLPVFLRKPYSYQDLLRAIRKAMEGDGRRGP